MDEKSYWLQFYQKVPHDVRINDWPLMDDENHRLAAEKMFLESV